MTLKTKVPLLLVVSTLALLGDTFTFSGPSLPVIGDPLQFKIFGAQLTSGAISGNTQTWVLTIETNYGDPKQNVFQDNPYVIPTVPYGSGGGPYPIGDFLITWQGHNYAVVLTDHDNYSAGSLYAANPRLDTGFLKSGDIMTALETERPDLPVLLAWGGTLLGSGMVHGALTGDGVQTARYTITDTFTAPVGFLAGDGLSIEMSSYVCGNGFLTVPEPRRAFLMVPMLLLFGGFLARRRGLQRS